jgi:hypothetical protein
LGPLETAVIEHLWTLTDARTVRQVKAAFPGLAYTTLMTTLDRLHRKGLVLRLRDGRAFSYQPRCSRDQWLGELAGGHVARLLAGPGATDPGAAGPGTAGPGTAAPGTAGRGSAGPGASRAILSMLVRTVGSHDAALLDELDALIQAERERLAEPAAEPPSPEDP